MEELRTKEQKLNWLVTNLGLLMLRNETQEEKMDVLLKDNEELLTRIRRMEQGR